MGEQFDATRPIYAQIAERMTGRILSGEYPPGAHLESVRELAAAAGVNPNTCLLYTSPSPRDRG